MPQIPHAQTTTTQISVINESTVITDADLNPVVAALQQQVTNDFRPPSGAQTQNSRLFPRARSRRPEPGGW